MIPTLALAAVSLALADDRYDRCMEAAVTNPDYAACGGQMLDRLDADLNAAWKKAYADLDASSKQALLAEQRLWIAYKDKSCDYLASGAYGREGQTVHFYTCRAAVIEDRIAYLADIGDTSGPDRDKDTATVRE